MIDLEIGMDPLRSNYLRWPLDRNNVDAGSLSPLKALYLFKAIAGQKLGSHCLTPASRPGTGQPAECRQQKGTGGVEVGLDKSGA